MVRSGDAEARPHPLHPEGRKKPSWLLSVSLLQDGWVRTHDFFFQSLGKEMVARILGMNEWTDSAYLSSIPVCPS